MSKAKVDEDFTYSEWYRPGGGMMYRRADLSHDHPESIPTLWKKQFGTPLPLWAARQIWPEREFAQTTCPCCGQVAFELDLSAETAGW
jgi:hypothetical protein